MGSGADPSVLVDMLLAGPRGRRFLLEYALASETVQNPVRGADSFGAAVVRASVTAGQRKPSTRAFVGFDLAAEEAPEVSLSEIGERLNSLELLAPTPALLRDALACAVAHASYWQEPEGEDVVSASREMHDALRRVAYVVAVSPLVAWWCAPVAAHAQQSVQWEDAPPKLALDDARKALLAAGDHKRAAGRSSLARRHVKVSGEWWSRPPGVVPSSTRPLFDGSPAGLWFVEDALGWESATSTDLIVPNGMRIFEIESAARWAELCARFPMDVTDQKGYDWERSTGKMARWVVPNWARVAEHYDAVHLQVGAYLAAAGTAISVDAAEAASVIAGWNPDETFWFTPDIAYGDARAHWMLNDTGYEMVWMPSIDGVLE